MKDGTYYTYTPQPLFDDLFLVTINKREVFTKKFLFFFRRKVMKVDTLFSGLHGDASKFLKNHPEIVLNAHYLDFYKIKSI